MILVPETGRTGVNIVIVARIVVMRLLMMGPSAHRVHMISEGLKYQYNLGSSWLEIAQVFLDHKYLGRQVSKVSVIAAHSSTHFSKMMRNWPRAIMLLYSHHSTLQSKKMNLKIKQYMHPSIKNFKSLAPFFSKDQAGNQIMQLFTFF